MHKNNIYIHSKTPLQAFNWGLESLLESCRVPSKYNASEKRTINDMAQR